MRGDGGGTGVGCGEQDENYFPVTVVRIES